MHSYETISKILRADKDTLRVVQERLSASTGKKDVMAKIVEENEAVMKDRLEFLGLDFAAGAKEIYGALISKIEADDAKFFEAMGRPSVETPSDYMKVLNYAKSAAGSPKGFFLKKEKAEELLRKEPPQKIIRSLGYENVDELLAKEDLMEIFSALRFLEDADWLNNVFFKQYENLVPSDFEEREVEARVLSPQWTLAAQSFVKKKYHNISHLKEMGLIFVIPISLNISGELLRNFSLILHYFNEVPFYSDLFKKFAAGENDFGNKVISLLRGDVIDKRLPEPAKNKTKWMVIQRYLAKDDENDWRLFEPHVNPEAIHWKKAERLLVKTATEINHFAMDLAFWENVDWVGNHFKTESGAEVLVSFNLVDTVMSLVKEKELIKYLYHHQESMWNKIFSEYFGEAKMEDLMKENLLRGWFEV
jgi:hypothetical protein